MMCLFIYLTESIWEEIQAGEQLSFPPSIAAPVYTPVLLVRTCTLQSRCLPMFRSFGVWVVRKSCFDCGTEIDGENAEHFRCFESGDGWRRRRKPGLCGL